MFREVLHKVFNLNVLTVLCPSIAEDAEMRHPTKLQIFVKQLKYL